MNAPRRSVVDAVERVRVALADVAEAVTIETDQEALEVAAKMLRTMASVPRRLAIAADARGVDVLFGLGEPKKEGDSPH